MASMIGSSAATVSMIAGALLLGASAGAQEGAAPKLTENEVHGFVGRMIDEAEAAAESGEWKSATDWMREHFAADGSLALRGAVVSAGRPAFTYDAALNGADIASAVSMADEGAVGAALSAVSDYSATAEVAYVDLLPNGEASAEVEIRETAALDLARLSGAPAADGASAVAIHSTSTCQLRLMEGADGAVVIRLGACLTTTTF